MAQLGLFKIYTNCGYQDLSEITGIPFTSGTTYSFQVLGRCTLCETDTKPTNGGIYIDWEKPFTYTSNGTKLWVRTGNNPCTINIMD